MSHWDNYIMPAVLLKGKRIEVGMTVHWDNLEKRTVINIVDDALAFAYEQRNELPKGMSLDAAIASWYKGEDDATRKFVACSTG